MDHFTTRIGGEDETRAGKLIPSFVVDTAGAPASGNPEGGAGAAPEWIELLPAGEFHGRDGRGPFRLADPGEVIESTVALGMKAGLPIDYDHATDFAAPEGRPAPAAGWIRELHARAGAIWGRVEWTARAAAAIVAREYRYISPVFQFDPSDGRVTRLLRAGLTNNPNLHLTAIAAAKIAAANPKDEAMQNEFVKELCEALGLGCEAQADQIIAAVKEKCAAAARIEAAMSAGVPDPARYVAVAEFERALTELNVLKAERAREQASQVVEEAIRAGKLSPAQREWAIAYCAADGKGFEAFAAKQPQILGREPALGRVAGAEKRASNLGAAEIAICAQLGLKHSDYLMRKSGRADFLSLERGDLQTEHD
ncbi:MAG: phage protease [Candidatus Binatus sp.]|uniref:phage protease n=1 Tax=Candidatus Binatus sp. TaxID=2811406 RepID=UPI00271A18DE|nr:phage protease [Candidatus Binatus sp.]MDO8433518.1 phage protease [Candidatus Binatus sp.]